MKALKVLLLILIALGAGYAGAAFNTSKSETKKETAYERVMKTGVLRCGYGLWPGSTDKDPNTGKLTGWVPAAAEALAAKLDLKIEWMTEFGFGQQATLLASGRVDALCTSDGPWVFSDAKYVDWTTPFIYYPIYVMVREDETRKTLAEFNNPNTTISTIDGDISVPLHRQHTPLAKRLDVPQMGDPSLLALNVDAHKADAAFLDKQTIMRITEKTPLKLRPLSATPVTVVPASFTVRKGETELLQMLNQGIGMLHNMGIMRQILIDQKLQDAAMVPANAWQPW